MTKNLFKNTILCLIFATIAGSCKQDRKNNNLETMSVPVKILQIKTSDVEDFFETYGVIESLSTTEISAEQDGNVLEIVAKEGDLLKEGDLVLKIDDRIYKADADRAEASFKLAESEYNRRKLLFDSKAVSEKEFEEALYTMKKARADFEAARVRLGKCEIRSPISAFIDKIYVELGENLAPGKKIARLEKTDIVKLVFFIPEQDIRAVSLGTAISYSFDSSPQEKFEGKITYLSRSAEENALTFRAEVNIENPSALLRPGMLARVRFARRTVKNAISFPIEAIIPKHGGHYVFIAENGKAKQREIKIAFFSAENAVIASGLNEGDKLIIDGGRFLREGDDLKIVEDF